MSEAKMAGSGDGTTGASSSQADWRNSVAQSVRSKQAKEVAEVLAALEPGASSRSKLMLAMRFENTIFEKATSMDDYRKTINKRIKKLQKNYKPPAENSTTQAKKLKEKEHQVELELRQQYGAALKYIVKNSEKAIRVMKEKHGESRSSHLKQHTDSAEQWAVEIGVIDEGTGPSKKRKRVPRDEGYLDKMKETFLVSRVDNIRSHVVKLVDPDLFLAESLTKVDGSIIDSAGGRALTQTTLAAFESRGLTVPGRDVGTMKKLMDTVTKPIPAPRKGAGEEQDIKDASLAYVERIRACTQAMVGFMAMEPQDRARFNGTLRKLHDSAVEGLSHLSETFATTDTSSKEISLEDAWTKVVEFKSTESSFSSTCATDVEQPNAKRLKSSKQVLKTRVLLTPGRKTPRNILPALESKQAKLVRPNGTGAGARLKMEFGGKFEFIMFFQPLSVIVRALGTSPKASREDEHADGKSQFRRTIVDGSLPTWPSANQGLSTADLSVSGVTGPFSILGTLVEEKLEFASARATHALRRCFADVAGQSYATAKSDFEIEISEATALLRYLQLVRDTFEVSSN
jgi:hypothetical protein